MASDSNDIIRIKSSSGVPMREGGGKKKKKKERYPDISPSSSFSFLLNQGN